MLHIGGLYVAGKMSDTPTYKCGKEKTFHPNMTDAEAMRLPKCPVCFEEAESRKEGWL